MNLKNQPTVMMPADLMYEVEREWKMSKAAWIDVAWDLAQQICGTEDQAAIEKVLRERAELVLMYRKRAKEAA
ncbi:hypothetical protein V1290_000083 [Bradyrhizobium sp. AZCC 1578]|uniref:hypothetical protein n=1 Tax=Bradyrhizobium sp. AZCC 1578 TaxID=3117027 RepID=UPI002FF4185E